MDVSEQIYENSGIMEDYRSSQSNKYKNPYEELYLNEETEGTKMTRTMTSAVDLAAHKCYRLSTVCLGLLCVLLLTLFPVLWNKLTAERDQLQQEKYGLHKKLSELENFNKEGLRYFNFHVYFISNEKKSWSESREDCRMRTGDLVVINSQEEQVFISRNFGSMEAWIGLKDSDAEGVWKWVDNSSLNSSFWWQGEPNDYGGKEDCARNGYKLSPHNHVSTWVDYPCTDPAVGLCERNISLK